MDGLDGNGLQLEPSFSSSTALCLGEGFVSSFDGYIPDLNPATPLARIAITSAQNKMAAKGGERITYDNDFILIG